MANQKPIYCSLFSSSKQVANEVYSVVMSGSSYGDSQ